MCFTFEEFVLEVVVVVVESDKDVDILVDTETVVEIELPPHMDMDNMVEALQELDIV